MSRKFLVTLMIVSLQAFAEGPALDTGADFELEQAAPAKMQAQEPKIQFPICNKQRSLTKTADVRQMFESVFDVSNLKEAIEDLEGLSGRRARITVLEQRDFELKLELLEDGVWKMQGKMPAKACLAQNGDSNSIKIGVDASSLGQGNLTVNINKAQAKSGRKRVSIQGEGRAGMVFNHTYTVR